MWRDTLRGWRAFAFVFFILVTLLSFAEVIGDVFAFFDVTASAQFGGIAPELEFQRLTSLSILSAAIALSAAVTTYGLWRAKAWIVRAGNVTGIVLLLYMGYQILSALTVLTANNFAVVGAGSTYGFFGLLGIWLVRRATQGTN